MTTLTILSIIIQIIIAIGLINVWIIRRKKATAYRGGNAQTMLDEFKAYGLTPSFMYAIGGLKIIIALSLLIGIELTEIIVPAAGTLAVLMVGALGMHFKVRDPWHRYMPALGIFILACALVIINII